MKLKLSLFTLLAVFCISSISAQTKIIKTDAEWKKILSPAEYHILREKGTEYAFSGKYDHFYEKGTYYCAGCNTPLFTSKSKFNSGSGWPSFDSHIGNNVGFHEDNKYGMKRTELTCNTCDGHLGHIFMDGPKKTTGKRYCINSLALKFKKSQ
ncbi:methionine sulfoxide reductase B [Wenyingzhuangia fucanilytica]|uniref:peptide-methionine (R)-S-oxide reductase n=1 Tax=Wenyingzhuangia fucanilytica TaxID=1790137 RepID=A0A1B1Y400_9FLAO|nr:peptide-methionine (R)-S-oxide reductase MsrB [Wenyingzhuangia fucanilytica]ANW95500.1 methionine sulfoxide reductase B [Wenyingzhuangia fucanilytica]